MMCSDKDQVDADNNSIKTDYAMSYQNIDDKLNHNGPGNMTGRRKSRFHKWLDVVLDMKGVKGLGEGKNNPNDSLESYELGQKSALREEALDREKTLMNVLKSVKGRSSKEDLLDGSAPNGKGMYSSDSFCL
jgi:hypothetical protein